MNLPNNEAQKILRLKSEMKNEMADIEKLVDEGDEILEKIGAEHLRVI